MRVSNLENPIMQSWIVSNSSRLDARPFFSGAAESRAILDKLSTPKGSLAELTLGGQKGIFHAGRESRNYVKDPKYGIPFISSSDILIADLSKLVLLSKKQVKRNPKFLIHEGWTLITRSGTIGKMMYVRPDMDGMACSEDVMRVVPAKEKILPGYLYAFLSSKFGVPLVISSTYGAIIQHIEPHHIADLPIPIPATELAERVHHLLDNSARLLSSYQMLIQNATDKLLQQNKIDNPSRSEWAVNENDLGFCVKSSDLKSFRAFNHSRRAKRLLDQIKQGRWDALGDLVNEEWLCWRKMFQRIDADPEYGIEVITQKPLFQLKPEGRWVSRKYLLSHSPKYIVPDQTVLIAKQGTLGEDELYCRSEFITGERMLKRAYSDHCMRIVARKEKIMPGYLFAFLRSDVVFRLLRALSEGSKQQDIHYRTIAELPVPRCDEKTELEIHEMVISAYEHRNKGIDLEEQGRHLVEEWIESVG